MPSNRISLHKLRDLLRLSHQTPAQRSGDRTLFGAFLYDGPQLFESGRADRVQLAAAGRADRCSARQAAVNLGLNL